MLPTRPPFSWKVLVALVALAGCGGTGRPNVMGNDASEAGFIFDEQGALDAADDRAAPPDVTAPVDAGDAGMPPPPDGMMPPFDGPMPPDMLPPPPDGMMPPPDMTMPPPPDVPLGPDVMDAGPMCPSGLMLCGSCINPAFDNGHCGRCNNPCRAGEVCMMGACRAVPDGGMPDMALPVDTGPVCPAGQTFCGSMCLDLTRDDFNCGACNNRCATGQRCTNSRCAAVSSGCRAGETDCAGYCANTASDPFHCGACNNRCPTGMVCGGGRCGGGSDGGVDAGSVTCIGGTTNCGGYCANTTNDPFHCGGCNQRCPDGMVCAGSRCGSGNMDGGTMMLDAGTVTCRAGETNCGGYCANTQSDPFHCGMCNNRCATGQSCSGARCTGTTSCGAGTTNCGGYCANTTNDPFHCGGCNQRCPEGMVCAGSRCGSGNMDGGTMPLDTGTVVCPTGRTNCSGYCADTTSDPFHCGACGNACPSGQTCAGSRCSGTTSCGAGTTNCGGYCANTTNDPFHCGGCNQRCPTGMVCAGSRCGSGNVDGGMMPLDTGTVTCRTGETNCFGFCTNTLADPFNCGACSNRCPAGATCTSGRCSTATCGATETNCSGYCADTRSDPSHCGGCGNACPTGQFCVNSRCSSTAPDGGMMTDTGNVTCPSGRTNCSGYCADTQADPFHCGACNNRCGAGQTCASGRCSGGTGMCTAGQTDCSGYCADTLTDPSHCGGCGNACPTGQVCAAGRCVSGAACGAMGQACCMGTTPCAASLLCISNLCTMMPINCGRSGQACCTPPLQCEPGTACSGGVCR